MEDFFNAFLRASTATTKYFANYHSFLHFFFFFFFAGFFGLNIFTAKKKKKVNNDKANLPFISFGKGSPSFFYLTSFVLPSNRQDSQVSSLLVLLDLLSFLFRVDILSLEPAWLTQLNSFFILLDGWQFLFLFDWHNCRK